MKDFFTNLIDRHHGKAETVAPRVRSHFENEIHPKQAGLGEQQQSAVQLEQGQPPLFSPGKTPPSDRQDRANVDVGAQIPGSPEPSGSGSDSHDFSHHAQGETGIAQQLETAPGRTKPEARVSANSQQIESSHRPLHASDAEHHAAVPASPFSDSTADLNMRMEAVLKRIRAFSKPESLHESNNEMQGLLARQEIDSIRTRPESEALRETGKEPVVGPGSMGASSYDDQDFDAEETSKHSRTSLGELELPLWLQTRQAESDVNNTVIKEDREPSINITIGRIEVKAGREFKSKPESSRKKPSGVMSLDEYLGQKQRKGAA